MSDHQSCGKPHENDALQHFYMILFILHNLVIDNSHDLRDNCPGMVILNLWHCSKLGE